MKKRNKRLNLVPCQELKDEINIFNQSSVANSYKKKSVRIIHRINFKGFSRKYKNMEDLVKIGVLFRDASEYNQFEEKNEDVK